MDHAILKRRLWRIIKDARLLELAGRIIDHGAPGSSPGKGLPIGNLTSQHFANFYLSTLDRFVKEGLRAQGYVRYMDDMLLFARSKKFLREAEARIGLFLKEELELMLKTEVTVCAPVTEGIPFLGLRLWPNVIRLDGAGKRKLISELCTGRRRVLRRVCAEDDLADSFRSRLGHAEHADTLALRRSLFGVMDLGSEAVRAITA